MSNTFHINRIAHLHRSSSVKIPSSSWTTKYSSDPKWVLDDLIQSFTKLATFLCIGGSNIQSKGLPPLSMHPLPHVASSRRGRWNGAKNLDPMPLASSFHILLLVDLDSSRSAPSTTVWRQLVVLGATGHHPWHWLPWFTMVLATSPPRVLLPRPPTSLTFFVVVSPWPRSCPFHCGSLMALACALGRHGNSSWHLGRGGCAGFPPGRMSSPTADCLRAALH
jgi:hypothetical protein